MIMLYEYYLTRIDAITAKAESLLKNAAPWWAGNATIASNLCDIITYYDKELDKLKEELKADKFKQETLNKNTL
jgi:hypothetical protein